MQSVRPAEMKFYSDSAKTMNKLPTILVAFANDQMVLLDSKMSKKKKTKHYAKVAAKSDRKVLNIRYRTSSPCI